MAVASVAVAEWDVRSVGDTAFWDWIRHGRAC